MMLDQGSEFCDFSSGKNSTFDPDYKPSDESECKGRR